MPSGQGSPWLSCHRGDGPLRLYSLKKLNARNRKPFGKGGTWGEKTQNPPLAHPHQGTGTATASCCGEEDLPPPSTSILRFCFQGKTSPCVSAGADRFLLAPSHYRSSPRVCWIVRTPLLPQGGGNFPPHLVERCRTSPGRCGAAALLLALGSPEANAPPQPCAPVSPCPAAVLIAPSNCTLRGGGGTYSIRCSLVLASPGFIHSLTGPGGRLRTPPKRRTPDSKPEQ